MEQPTRLVMPTKAPTAKLTVGTLTGVGSSQVGNAVADIVVYYLNMAAGATMPDAVAQGFHLIFATVFGIGIGLLAGWYMPPSASDTPVRVPAGPPGAVVAPPPEITQ